MTQMPAPTVPWHEVRAARCPAPAVSVLVPTYNTRAHVREAVDSLLAQTWADLEVVVIDDASTDGSTDVLMDIDDPRLRIVRLARNVGLSGARNAAIALSRGEFVALLDADDVAMPRRIERQAAVLRTRPDVGLVGCLVQRIDGQGRQVGTGSDPWCVSEAALKPLMLYTNPFPAVYMLRRSAIPPHGFRPLYAEDYNLAVDIARQHDVALVREALVGYRISPTGIMRTRLDEVADGAMVAQRELLSALQVRPTAEDEKMLRIMLYLGRQERGVLNLAWLRWLRGWMQQLIRANETVRRYDGVGLREASARMWEVALVTAAKQERLRLGPSFLPLWTHLIVPAGSPSRRARALAWSVVNWARA